MHDFSLHNLFEIKFRIILSKSSLYIIKFNLTAFFWWRFNLIANITLIYMKFAKKCIKDLNKNKQ